MPRPDRFENVELGFLLERDQKMFPEKHAQLLAADCFAAIKVSMWTTIKR